MERTVLKIGDIVTVKPHVFVDMNGDKQASNFAGRTGRIVSIDIILPSWITGPRYALVAFSNHPDEDCNFRLEHLRAATNEEITVWRTNLS